MSRLLTEGFFLAGAPAPACSAPRLAPAAPHTHALLSPPAHGDHKWHTESGPDCTAAYALYFLPGAEQRKPLTHFDIPPVYNMYT